MAAVGRRGRLPAERGAEDRKGSVDESATQCGRGPGTVQRWLRWIRWTWDKELEP
jgi:hypothetical protein